jgi:hypothetical protein
MGIRLVYIIDVSKLNMIIGLFGSARMYSRDLDGGDIRLPI